MNTTLLAIMRCPSCRGRVILADLNRGKVQDIINGSLGCQLCQKTYSIQNGIPDFLPPELANDEAQLVTGDKVKQANMLYHDMIAKKYNEDISTFAIFQPYTKSRIAEIFDYIRTITEGKLVLDLGCGTGNLLSICRKYFQESIGIDISKGMLSLAREGGFEVMCADVENIPFNDEIADAVTCFSVLHHLYEPVYLFREAFRVLKKGGILYTDYDPNYTSKVLQHSLLFRVAKNIFKVLHKCRVSIAKDPFVDGVQKVAEYHHNIKDGLDPLSLNVQLKNIGFKDIQIIQHGNCYSLKKNNFWHIPVTSKGEIMLKFLISWKLSYCYLAPHFLILAQK